MSIDAFAKISGVPGEATHKNHAGEVQLDSWSWGVQQISTGAVGSGTKAKGKASSQPFTFSHNYDKASTALANHCAAGTHFEEIVVSCAQATGEQNDFLKVTMKECLISSVSIGAGSGGVVSETISVDFTSIEYEYTPYDAKGKKGGSLKFGWDLAKEVVS
jgi:type VI secretion system secreted protein Hcp